MKRAGLVASATTAGLVGLMMFHTRPATVSLGPLTSPPSTSMVTRTKLPATTTTRPDRTVTTTTRPPSTITTPGRVTTPTTTATTPVATTTKPVVLSRTVAGALVSYGYGTLSVSVTGSASHITNVGIASIDDGGDSRSASIDDYSIPSLEAEALRAQSANIQGVSGASYTSRGFEQSLQSALSKLRQG